MPPHSVSWCVLWKVAWGSPRCIHVPEERADYYVRRHGWHVLISDTEFPVQPSTWPLNVQSNPRRDTSEES